MYYQKLLIIGFFCILSQGCTTVCDQVVGDIGKRLGCPIGVSPAIPHPMPSKKIYHSDKPVVMFILDTSGSMAQVESGISKIETAKTSIINTINQIDIEKYNTSLITFDNDSCKADLVVEPNNSDADKIIDKVRRVIPQGPTPLAKAITLSGEVLSNVDKKMIVLFSDGGESCNEDPVRAARKLDSQYGININVQVIGYAVNTKAASQLREIANISDKWNYHSVGNPEELKKKIFKIMRDGGVLRGCWKDDSTCVFQFSSGSAAIKGQYEKDIIDIYNYLNENKEHVEIIGHTDNIGTESYNMQLSLDRANMVRTELVQKGINVNRINTKGMGESVSISDNKTEIGRKMNRRVEIKIIKPN